MNLQTSVKEGPEINLTSLIDVVLLLLVFFMVSTSFVHETDITLRLPQTQTEANNVSSSSDVIEIAVTEAGTYLVNGRLLVDDQQDTLSSFIEEIIGDSREQTVVIRADAKATHQAVVTVLDVVGKLGFVEINIATVILPEV
ncbi:MAG: biopolymer transporter ExbD [Gammaproteobacteria bacterium]|jgi:biopolymer transport protein ExbD|nr:biopolymer transporter ExbD [Gammaproteobacteria bacterium]|tara:strand:+ start:238 stop:663 length:426 start_codon:yes stop_codon:yes gene_type:complete